MTPPIRPATVARYDLGNFRIHDKNQNKRFDAGIDEVEGTSLVDARKQLKKLGITLKDGAGLNGLAYRVNFEQAKVAAKAGDLVKTRKRLDRAALHAQPGKQAEFQVQKDFLLFSGAENFLKLAEPARSKQLSALEASDLKLLRGAGQYLASNQPSQRAKLNGTVERYHRLFAVRELGRAEVAAKNCDSKGAAASLLAAMDASFQAKLPVDERRIKGIQSALGQAECKSGASKRAVALNGPSLPVRQVNF